MNKILEELTKKAFESIPVETYKKAYKQSKTIGNILTSALLDYLSLGYELDDDFCANDYKDMLTREFLINRDMAMSAQRAMNERMGISLKVQEPHSSGAIENYIKKALDAEFRRPSITSALKEFGTKTISKCAKDNAEFQARSGLKYWVVRTNDNKGLSGGRRCDYCDRWSGKHENPIPEECWGFHDGCGCKMMYYNVKGYSEEIH